MIELVAANGEYLLQLHERRNERRVLLTEELLQEVCSLEQDGVHPVEVVLEVSGRFERVCQYAQQFGDVRVGQPLAQIFH